VHPAGLGSGRLRYGPCAGSVLLGQPGPLLGPLSLRQGLVPGLLT
jgi:hypothetical protein